LHDNGFLPVVEEGRYGRGKPGFFRSIKGLLLDAFVFARHLFDIFCRPGIFAAGALLKSKVKQHLDTRPNQKLCGKFSESRKWRLDP